MSNAAPREMQSDGVASRRLPTVSAWYLPLFLLLAVWSTWPLARKATTDVPLGVEPIATVPMFNVWTVWWNADRLRHGLRGYWQAPIFYPTDGTFAFSETQPTTMLVAPVVWCSKTPILAYNVYLLANLALNGWVAARVLNEVYGRRFAAIVGGAMVVLLPFVHWQLDVLQLAPLWGILWTLAAAWKFGEDPRIGRGMSAGLAFGVTYLLCNHYGLFLSVLLVPAGICLLWKNLCRRTTWVRLLPGLAVAVLLIAPLAVVQFRASRQHEWQRPDELVQRLSAEFGDYTVSAWPQLAPIGDLSDPVRGKWWPLSPGNVKIVLAIMGLAGGLSLRRHRRWTAACFAILLLGMLLSLGPKFSIGAVVPYHWVVEWYPGFSQVRNVFRFAVFVQLMTAILACGGLVVLAQFAEWSAGRMLRSSRKSPAFIRRAGLAASAVLIAAVGGCCVFEVRPPEPRLYSVPSIDENREWIDWLRDNTQPDDVIASIPFPGGNNVGAYEETAVVMYWGTFHGRRMVNGYSGFFPAQYYELESAMWDFPDERSTQLLRDRDVRYCVVRRPKPGTPSPKVVGGPGYALVRVFSDDRAEIDLYRITVTNR
jgi:Family of unknown function (DUF6541)